MCVCDFKNPCKESPVKKLTVGDFEIIIKLIPNIGKIISNIKELAFQGVMDQEILLARHMSS